MNATVEVSLYPLTEEYESVVLEFLDHLEKTGTFQFTTNGLSTQIFGELPAIFTTLAQEFENIQESGKAVLVLKVAAGKIVYEGKHNREIS